MFVDVTHGLVDALLDFCYDNETKVLSENILY